MISRWRLEPRNKTAAVAVAAVAMAALAMAQQQPQIQTPPAGAGAVAPQAGRGRGGGRPEAYPQHPPGDPAAIDRGKAIFGVQCSFCHGSDARGGEGGPNLIRAEIVMRDQNGETIAPVVQNGRVDRGMPKFDLSAAQISDIAAFIHTFRVGGYDISRDRPPTIVVGNAAAGEAYFKTTCAGCHSATGDLKGLATKIEDPRSLQQAWLMPGGGRGGRGGGGGALPVQPVTVTVTMPSGQKIEGRLERIDDFLVTLVDADGLSRSIRRDGDTPKVEIHDPLDPHKKLLGTYTDKDIHNLTAYLVTLK
jgi:cytochrome c oxidase cbb3-type subunit 3